ncbi:urea ABC transporter permease subunit UrtB [Thiocapsa marina]|uniref:Urea ABC transporter, permease protein UrtB n=1 Tax=Thiocapsa marina 5811 TaxID=768671 RepID=F9UDX5_9GAMM|nr:urea ABC transporter permease subunit UrtB [Thiocapsa marina]EGV17532.1 urea ABC transporter, permease protein UrtB [Thiocapsa marina 5811]
MPLSPTSRSRRLPRLADLGLVYGFLILMWLPLGSLADEIDSALIDLSDRSFDVKQAAVEAIAIGGDPRAAGLFQALLAGDLYARKDDRRPVLVTPAPGGYRLTDAFHGSDLGEVERGAVKKITINNRMRNQLRTAIAALTLASPDPAIRLEAAQQMLGDADPMVIEAIREQLGREDDQRVRDYLDLSLALASLRDEDPAVRLASVETLAGSLYPESRNALSTLLNVESDPQVRVAAERALAATEQRLKLNAAAETLFFGLSLGSVLVLAAIGLAITFGVMGVINMAHGELIMIGAYTTYLVQQAMPGFLDYSLFVAIPAAFVVAGLLGILIERTVIRFLYGRPLETLLATFGISLILQQLVRTTISAQNVAVQNPSWMSGALQINPALALTYNRLYILFFSLIVFVALLLILKRTALGLQVRAVAQNRAMARSMGVRSARVDALTFGLGAGVAGVAGVALSQLTNVGPNMGQAYIIDSFMVVVFGGVGNLWGTLVAGLTLGVANKLMEPWAGAVLAKILVLVFIILFIQKRPRGLFPQRGRAADG